MDLLFYAHFKNNKYEDALRMKIVIKEDEFNYFIKPKVIISRSVLATLIAQYASRNYTKIIYDGSERRKAINLDIVQSHIKDQLEKTYKNKFEICIQFSNFVCFCQ